ncbi:uncharacterized protein LOC131674925 [Phymastichus coffea]|uniref:uncharacterized protein LOC131673822 n=1 Tax=Phymastichus coffea TaxID=108790 RepID=UPI00273BF1F1|nr:uncharacterized protein LOC131673822 [Phymastichus coffea]XP_058809724.1 uncharacterized protein LOC131674925 [Phymastichus coffea]
MRTQFLLLLALLVGAHGAKLPKKKVCVIGAGACGIISLKQFVDHPDEFEVIAFDKNSDVGGLWIYTDSTTLDEYGLPVHSSMYKYLRTNLPKEIMATPDYREFNGDRSCVTHETVLQYLRNYTDHFQLRRYIQHNTLVDKVTPIRGNSDWRTTKYTVESHNLITNESAVTTCDAVSVCNGHYFKPHLPIISNLESFPGRVLHSHIYRKPEDFAGQTVVILGASLSGIDLSIEIAKYAKKIYLSHNKPKITSPLPENVIQVTGVVGANGDKLILKDESNITAEVLIFCTGYEFDYPFLDKNSSGIEVVNNHVKPLYKQLINIKHPSMAIVGLPILALHFPIFYIQSQYFLALLQGKVKLPSREEMLEDSERLPPGKPERYAHFLGPAQWAYNDDLAKLGQFESLPKYYKRGGHMWTSYRDANILHYKESDLIIHDDGSVEIVHVEGRH